MDVVPSHGNQSFFTLATRMHTRRVQGTHSGPLTLEEYVALVEVQGNETVLKDSTVEVLDYDEYGNVLEVDVSTEGVDAGMHVTRTVKNDVGKWLLGLPDTQTECSTGDGLTSCRTIAGSTLGDYKEYHFPVDPRTNYRVTSYAARSSCAKPLHGRDNRWSRSICLSRASLRRVVLAMRRQRPS